MKAECYDSQLGRTWYPVGEKSGFCFCKALSDIPRNSLIRMKKLSP